MKQRFLRLMYVAGAFSAFRLAHRRKLLVLTYHRFCNSDDGLSMQGSVFEQQLQYLGANYHVAPLSTIAQRLAAGTALPPRTAAITIDDGYQDAYGVALSLLKKYQLPATIFVVTNFIDKKSWLWTDKLRFIALKTDIEVIDIEIGGKALKLELTGRTSRLQAADRANSILKQLPDHEKERAIERIACSLNISIPELPPREFEALSWDELREMAAFGIEIGSHTVSHPILTRIDSGRLRHELRDSKLILEELLDRPISLFCYPNGDSNKHVRNEVSLAGYTCAVTTAPGLNGRGTDLLALRRIHGEHDLAHFAQSTSGFQELKSSFGLGVFR
jgi:peptidoglycan/xylan/chitin deacetylase (PgdA/CDA1 family)